MPSELQRLTAALSLLDGVNGHYVSKARDLLINEIDRQCREIGGRAFDDLPPLARDALEAVG